MANLLSNAAKFSFEDSTVNVEIKQNSDRVCVAVTEQGPGIPEDFQGKIFDKFG
jgi:K+-sensing histidine kinase KdpD